MNSDDPRSLKEIMRTGHLARLVDQARQRLETTNRVRAMLPSDEAQHVVAASVGADGELTIVMDSAVWAARVRYRQEQLGAVSLRVRVAPCP